MSFPYFKLLPLFLVCSMHCRKDIEDNYHVSLSSMSHLLLIQIRFDNVCVVIVFFLLLREIKTPTTAQITSDDPLV